MKKGGLARRAGKIQELRETRENFILVDCGDMFHNTRTIPEVRAKIIIEGMSRMQYDAVNLADGELELGTSFLKTSLDSYPLNLVSANINIKTDQKAKKSLISPYVIKDFGSFKVAVTGITAKVLLNLDTRFNKDVGFSEPLSSLVPVLSALKDKADMVILLSHFMMDGTKSFLAYNPLPQVSVAIAGHGRKLTKKAETVKDTLIVQNSMGGEYLSVLTLDLDDSLKITGHTVENIALTDEVPEDQFLQAKLKEFKATESKVRADRHKKGGQKANISTEQKEILQLSPEAFIRQMGVIDNTK